MAPHDQPLPLWLERYRVAFSKSPLLLALFESIEPSHQELVPTISAQLEKLTQDVVWFNDALQQRIGDAQFIETLQQLATGPVDGSNPDARVSDHWRELTLHGALKSGAPGMRHLVALFVVALLDRRNQSRSVPSRTAYELFAQSIRGISEGSVGHQDRPTLDRLERSSSWQDCGQRFVQNLRGLSGATKQSSAWPRTWNDWLSLPVADVTESPGKEFEEPSPEAPSPPKKIRTNPARPPRARLTDRPRARSLRLPVEGPDKRVGAEPQGESTPAREFVFTSRPLTTGRRLLLDRAHARALCFQAIRQQNWDLHPDHIDVLSGAELHLVVTKVRAAFEHAASTGTVEIASACAIYLLTLVTGRDEERVAAIPLLNGSTSSPPQDIEIDLQTGELRQPVIRPDGAIEVDDHNDSPLLQTLKWFALPLPPTVLGFLRALDRTARFLCLHDGLGGRSPTYAVRRMLRTIDSLTPITRLPARARRWLGPRLMEVTDGDVAAAMLICGDTFGRTTTPLYYYSPRVATLRNIYRTAVWPIFNDPVTEPDQGEDRIGSEINVSEVTVLTGLRTIHRHLDHAHIHAADSGWGSIAEFHNRLTAYVLDHFSIITTDRPVAAKFELRRNDIDTEHRLAILSDKRVDAAHWTRPAALSKLLAQQLDCYLDHLGQISELQQAPETVRSRSADALRSDSPLFFFIDPVTGEAIAGTVDLWTDYWPDLWKKMPKNWYRHYVATQLREHSAEPGLIMAQCGHLEAAAFPFSEASPISPRALEDSLQKPLAAIESKLDFRLRHPLGLPGASTDTDRLKPLMTWDNAVESHRRKLRAAEWSRLKDIGVQRKASKSEGLKAGLAELEQVAPELHELVMRDRTARFVSGALCERARKGFRPAQAQDLIDRIDSLSGGANLRIMARDQVSRLIRAVSMKYDLAIPDIGQVFLMRPAEPSPFVPGGLLALRQISALRSELIPRAAQLRDEAPDLSQALSLILLGGVTSDAELTALLAGGKPLGLVRHDGPCLLLSARDASGEHAVGFRGAAAIALATAQQETLTRDPGRISELLHQHFKNWFVGCAPSKALGRLLQTNRIASLFELSGLARTMAAEDGSTPAPASLQVALLTNSVTRPDGVHATPYPDLDCSEQTGGPADIDAPSAAKSDSVKRALAFYNRELLPAIGGGSETSPENQRRATLERVKLDLWSLTKNLPSEGPVLVEHQLAHFAERMATEGTDGTRNPEPSTIMTYVTSIGRSLVTRLAGIDLRKLSSEDFAEMYLEIIEDKPEHNTQVRAARQLLRFHEGVQNRARVAPIELAELSQYLSRQERAVTANAITELEYRHARDALGRETDRPDDHPLDGCHRRRLVRMVRLVLALLRASGGRFREILYLRHSDVLVIGSFVALVVRSNQYRDVKTAAGRRLINLTSILTDEEIDELRVWIDGEKIRHGSTFHSGCLLFDRMGNADHVFGRTPESTIRLWIERAFENGTGRRCWPHLMRHGFADRAVRAAFTQPIQVGERPRMFMRTRRIRAIALALGHRSIATTARCYLHHPWVGRAIESPEMLPDIGRTEIAAITGRGLAGIDKARQRPIPGAVHHLEEPTRDLVLSERMLVRMSSPVVTVNQTIGEAAWPLANTDTPHGPHRLLDFMLRQARTPQDFERLGHVVGLTPEIANRMLNSVAQVDAAFGYRLINSGTEDADTAHVARRIGQDNVGHLLSALDSLDTSSLLSLAALFIKVNRTRQALRANRFVGPQHDINTFHGRLAGLGIHGLRATPLGTAKLQGRLWSLEFERGPGTLFPFDYLRWILFISVAISVALRHLDISHLISGAGETVLEE